MSAVRLHRLHAGHLTDAQIHQSHYSKSVTQLVYWSLQLTDTEWKDGFADRARIGNRTLAHQTWCRKSRDARTHQSAAERNFWRWLHMCMSNLAQIILFLHNIYNNMRPPPNYVSAPPNTNLLTQYCLVKSTLNSPRHTSLTCLWSVCASYEQHAVLTLKSVRRMWQDCKLFAIWVNSKNHWDTLGSKRPLPYLSNGGWKH